MEDRLRRQIGESKYNFIKRIVLGKLVDKTIDEDYTELSELVFGEGNKFNSSEVRKRFYGIKRLLEILDEEGFEQINLESQDAMNEIDQKIIELDKARKKLQATKVEYNKMIRETAHDELIIDSLRDAMQTVEPPTFERLQSGENLNEWLLCFGDIHYDKFYESINNTYSIEEVHRRFNLLLSKMVDEIENKGINKLYILNTGDSLEGILRISAYKTMRIGLLQAVVDFSRFMAEWLNELSKYVEIVYYHVPTANHSEIRMFNQKRGETDENLEKVIVDYIHDLLKNNPRVEVPITTNKNYVDFQINGYDVVALHGDGIKNIKNSIKDLSFLHKKFYSYCIMGHFHSGMETTVAEGYSNNMEVIVVPSIVGSDEYSDSLFVGSKSSAKLFGFTKNEGHTDTKTFILN